MIKQNAPEVRRPRIRISAWDPTDNEVRFIPLVAGKHFGKFDLSNLQGPGITGEVIYDLKRKGEATVTTADEKQYLFTLEP